MDAPRRLVAAARYEPLVEVLFGRADDDCWAVLALAKRARSTLRARAREESYVFVTFGHIGPLGGYGRHIRN